MVFKASRKSEKPDELRFIILPFSRVSCSKNREKSAEEEEGVFIERNAKKSGKVENITRAKGGGGNLERGD